MSYARFSEGDLYLFENISGGWTCQFCLLEKDNRNHEMCSLEEVEQHLLNHIEVGHSVPDRALERVRRELEGEVI